MRISASRFAAALAARCDEAAPPSVRVHARADGGVDIERDGREVASSGMARVVDDDDGSTWDERVDRAARAILGTVQDGVCEALTDPWPLDAAGTMADVFCTVDASGIDLGYGTVADPVLPLRRMPFGEIAAG